MANDESGGFSKNFVPRKEVTVSDTEPADAKEGDWWYDTGNDSMKFYTGSSFVSPGNTLDKRTIFEDSQGNIRTPKLYPNQFSNLVRVQERNDVQTTIVDITLASNEYVVVHSISGIGGGNYSAIEVQADGNTLTSVRALGQGRNNGSAFVFIQNTPPFIAEDSLKIIHKPDDDFMGTAAQYEVRTE